MILPDYDNSVLSTVASILKRYGGESLYPSIPELDALMAPAPKHVVMLLLDGMGQLALDAHLPEDSFLRRNLLRTVTAVFPSTTAASTVRDTISLIDSAEDLLRRSGTQLDSGTEATLKSLSETLRRTADVMAASGSIKTAKDAMTDIVEDLWNDHTGDVDNLLLMDATAQAESLTDPRNGTPQSVQVLIRSQEIKAEEPEAPEEAAQTAAGTTFWGRVAQMFKDFWNAITGIFQK